MRATLRLTVGFMMLLVVPRSGEAQPTPLAVLKKANTEVERLVKRHVPKGSPQEKKLKQDIKGIVGGLIDYDELAQQALHRHWDELSAAQRADFTRVFRELIERNYSKQIRGNVDYEVSYKSEKVTGERADVRTVIRAKRKGRTADTTVDYKMLLRQGKWKVYDVITDEDEYSGLVMNYRSEFNKIWNKDGFEGVMRKMKKRLAEVED
jgi:phospholipid transport system substrate-binding protein